MENVLKVLDGWQHRRYIRNNNPEISQKRHRALLVNCERRGFDRGTVEKVLTLYDRAEEISRRGRTFSESYAEAFDIVSLFDEIEECPQKQSFAEYSESLLEKIKHMQNFTVKVEDVMRSRSGQITDREIDSLLVSHFNGSMGELINFHLALYKSTLMAIDFTPSDSGSDLIRKYFQALMPTVPYTTRKLYRDVGFTS